MLEVRPFRGQTLTRVKFLIIVFNVPVKNSIKTYLENSYYHIYNRGVDKRNIFHDEKDYKVFLHFLKRYLTPLPETLSEVRPRWRSDLFNNIELVSYCLMPNHFHLMIKQQTKEGIANFMQSLMNSYVYYFNKKLQRKGPLFEGRYKAALVDNEIQLLHLTRYIHLNPTDLVDKKSNPLSFVQDYPFSSYKDFLGERKAEWVHPEKILQFFKTMRRTSLKDILSYQSFVEDYIADPKEVIGDLILD